MYSGLLLRLEPTLDNDQRFNNTVYINLPKKHSIQ